MVFYTEKELSSAGLKYLPTEIWFIIYKKEHQSKMSGVHNELVEFKLQVEFANLNLIMETIDWPDVLQNWTLNEYIFFRNSSNRYENG